MKKLLMGTLLLGLCYSTVHATYSRIESMGKNSTYIMDDMSIFDNPANIGIYPNYLIGEMGQYLTPVGRGENVDPQTPWFGGIFSLGLGDEEGGDPRISIAGAFNRIDQNLFRFFPDKILSRDGLTMNPNAVDSQLVVDVMNDPSMTGQEYGYITDIPDPTTNFDGFLGFSTESGNLFGLHVYVAYQDGAIQNQEGLFQLNSNANTSAIKLDGGANFQVSESIDAELSLGMASLQYGYGKFIDWSNLSYMANARLFSTIEAINGELVPTASFANYVLPGRETSEIQAGLGVNVSMDDQGFFWLGFDFIRNYNEYTSGSFSYSTSSKSYPGFYNHDGEVVYSTFRTPGQNTPVSDVMTETGGKISFGIERSIWWDWFIIRVGGQKVITYVNCELGVNDGGYCGEFTEATESGNYMRTNAMGNGTNDDHVGFGFGVNIEEKFKVDVTVAEDLLYRNPFVGEGRFFSRLSATYSF